MSRYRRLMAAVDTFLTRREQGRRQKAHLKPLLDFIAAELTASGAEVSAEQRKQKAGLLYPREVDFLFRSQSGELIIIFVITQVGSIRNNLNNRRRDIVGDAANLRFAFPDARIGLLYLMRADAEATQKNRWGKSAIDELVEFLLRVQAPVKIAGSRLLDAAAVVAPLRRPDGKIVLQPVDREVDVLHSFFERLLE